MNRSLRFVIVPAALVLLLPGCADEPAPRETARAAPRELAVVDSATTEVPLTLPAQLYVEHDAAVAARSSGVVSSIAVDLGGRVAAGQLLARLESTDQEIALARARAALAQAERDMERQRALAAIGGVTRAEAEGVELALEQARLALRQARRDFELTRIVAPFAGVVTARLARVQRLVSEGDTLFRVTAERPLLASVRIPEGAPADVGRGATALVADVRGATAPARVLRVSPAIDPASGTREVVLAVAPGPDAPGLVPGASVTVRLGSERRRVVSVPQASIDSAGYALVWERDRTTLRAVTLGAQLGDGRVEVLSGLTPGERIVPAASR